MTKALLTVKDVKAFIHECMVENILDETLTRLQVLKKYNLSEPTYNKYLKKGMPWYGKPRRKRFRQKDIESWFIQNDLCFILLYYCYN